MITQDPLREEYRKTEPGTHITDKPTNTQPDYQ